MSSLQSNFPVSILQSLLSSVQKVITVPESVQNDLTVPESVQNVLRGGETWTELGNNAIISGKYVLPKKPVCITCILLRPPKIIDNKTLCEGWRGDLGWPCL